MSELFKHQKDLLEKFPSRHALVWGCGVGKTRTAMHLAQKANGGFLVICPKALKGNWGNEIKKWEGTSAYHIISKEEFRRDWEKIGYYKTVIVDEAHFFFGQNSAMMKSLRSYFKKNNTPHRYFLTATPYLSTPWNTYRMCELLGYKLDYLEFKKKFFYEVRMGNRMIPVIKKDIEADIAKIVQRVGSTVKMEDCIDVPDQTFEEEYFDLTREQKKAIEGLTDVEPIVRFTKIHQIAGGTLKDDGYMLGGNQVYSCLKRDRLMDILKDNQKVIVVCRYNYEIEVLMDMCLKAGLNTAKITGEVSGDERHKTIELLKHMDKYVLLVNAACSEGWELPECPLMVFYSYDFSLKNYVQICGRIQRIHNVKKNTHLSLLTKDTIDEDIFKSVTIKKMDFHIEIYGK